METQEWKHLRYSFASLACQELEMRSKLNPEPEQAFLSQIDSTEVSSLQLQLRSDTKSLVVVSKRIEEETKALKKKLEMVIMAIQSADDC